MYFIDFICILSDKVVLLLSQIIITFTLLKIKEVFPKSTLNFELVIL